MITDGYHTTNPRLCSKSVKLIGRYEQIFLLPVKFFRNASAFVFVCFLKVLSSLSLHHDRQTTASNLSSPASPGLSQHDTVFVVYLGNEMSLTVYLSVTESFFVWGSQRKCLIYVDAIFVTVVAPMLYTLSLLIRFIPTKPMAVTQLLCSMNRRMPFLKPRMSIFVFSTNDHGVVCYHNRFCFRRHFFLKKCPQTLRHSFATVPNQCLALKKFCAFYSVWVMSWSFSPTSPSGAFVTLFSVTSTRCRSDYYPIFR